MSTFNERTGPLKAGDSLNPGDKLWSPGLKYFLVLQGDGNLVLYNCPILEKQEDKQDTIPIWQADFKTSPNAKRVTLGNDGSLKAFNGNGAQVWSFRNGWHMDPATEYNPYLQVQDDGKFVIYVLKAAVSSK